jgi:hypothetical protein
MLALSVAEKGNDTGGAFAISSLVCTLICKYSLMSGPNRPKELVKCNHKAELSCSLLPYAVRPPEVCVLSLFMISKDRDKWTDLPNGLFECNHNAELQPSAYSVRLLGICVVADDQ